LIRSAAVGDVIRVTGRRFSVSLSSEFPFLSAGPGTVEDRAAPRDR
jgi:hypothetical protein